MRGHLRLAAVLLLFFGSSCTTDEEAQLLAQKKRLDLDVSELEALLKDASARKEELAALRAKIDELDREADPERVKPLATESGAATAEALAARTPGTWRLRVSGEGTPADADAFCSRLAGSFPLFVVDSWSFDGSRWTVTLEVFRIPEWAAKRGPRPPPFVDPATRPLPDPGIPTPSVKRARGDVLALRAALARLETELRAQGFAEGGYELNRTKKQLVDLLKLRTQVAREEPKSLEWVDLLSQTLSRATVSRRPPSVAGQLAPGVTLDELRSRLPPAVKIAQGVDGAVTLGW